jgi:hypothetical protein
MARWGVTETFEHDTISNGTGFVSEVMAVA